ncbi:hypothetical protein ACFFWC_17490 [Plantactinospora siamensis]|uniref:Uncharacterized protein n=1 Tax=Plantactinospora siamensis TaxID=555372 RepID=A0ABV6NPG7_9ACTN
MPEPARYSVVECVVTGHHPLGLLARLTHGGDEAVLERVPVEDAPLDELPPVGAVLPAVVLGRTADGRLRLAGRPAFVALVRSAADPAAALDAWSRIRAADEAYAEACHNLFSGPDAAAVLCWALDQPAGSPQLGFALRALRDAPTELKLGFVDELLRVSTEGTPPSAVRQVLSSIHLSVDGGSHRRGPRRPNGTPPPRSATPPNSARPPNAALHSLVRSPDAKRPPNVGDAGTGPERAA